MNQHRRILAKACLGVLAIFLLADTSWAAGIGFRNDTRFTIIVQGSTTVGGVVKRGPALVIPPGKMAWDNNLMNGPRLVTIFDADQGNAVLFRQPVLLQGQNLFFLVQPAAVAPPGQPKALQLKDAPLPPAN